MKKSRYAHSWENLYIQAAMQGRQLKAMKCYCNEDVEFNAHDSMAKANVNNIDHEEML